MYRSYNERIINIRLQHILMSMKLYHTNDFSKEEMSSNDWQPPFEVIGCECLHYIF